MGFTLVNEGDYSVQFGGYEWLILKKYDDHMLVILEDLLEQSRRYQENYEAITWEECTLRKWLNKDFYNTFTPKEQARIMETHLENPDNKKCGTKGGNDTTDKIFLLSLDEAEEYMTADERSVNSWWWLRRLALVRWMRRVLISMALSIPMVTLSSVILGFVPL